MRYRIALSYLTTLPSVVETEDIRATLQAFADAKRRAPHIGPLTFEPGRARKSVVAWFKRNDHNYRFCVAWEETDNAQTEK